MENNSTDIKQEIGFDSFEILEPLGCGTFANVYLVRHIISGQLFAMKSFFWNVSLKQILNEIKNMRKFIHPNINKIITVIRQENQISLILEFKVNVRFMSLLSTINASQIINYMKSLLTAIEFIHSKNYIHRDIKPSNFLYDPKTKSGVLIDFGFCEEFKIIDETNLDANPNLEIDLKNPQSSFGRTKISGRRAGTCGFRAPEVLFRSNNQTTAIDVWSAGVVLLSLLTYRYPFFNAKDDLTSLCQIAEIVGSFRLNEAAMECNRKIHFPHETEGLNLKLLVLGLNPLIRETKINMSICELLERMLEPVPSKRITAKEALKHPIFSES